MVTQQQMLEALVELMPDPSTLPAIQQGATDADIDAAARGVIGESGLDVDGVYGIAGSIVQMAVQFKQDPESAVIGAFVTGVAMTCILNKKGALR